jgi:hydroxyacylglutathione hydrolase
MPVHVFKCGYANTYLLEEDGSFGAIDVGTFWAAEKIYDYLHSRSMDSASLRMVTATHFHIDHIGGISRLIKFFPETKVLFYAKVGDYIARKDKICLFPFFSWIKDLRPVLISLDDHRKNLPAALKSDWAGIPIPLLRKHLLSLHEVFCTLGEVGPIPYLTNWKLIHTPGHTNDSICLYNPIEKALISGDTILNMEGSGELNKFCCDRDSIKESFKALSMLNIERIYPGHGDPLLNIEGLSAVLR